MAANFLGLLLTIFVLVISSALVILINIFGWGLTPQNWWIIIGGVVWNIFSVLMLSIVSALLQVKEKMDKEEN
jgi:uncharacterized membrane protein